MCLTYDICLLYYLSFFFRFYMQLPLPIAHRYHVGTSTEIFQKEIDDANIVVNGSLSVDSRVLEKVQEIVRQGFINPFLVRAAAKVLCFYY